jgi:hypothetical protein
MGTEELAAEGEGASVSRFGGVVISEPVGGVGPCNPVSDEPAVAWLLASAPTVFGGDLQVSILYVQEILKFYGVHQIWS